MSFFIDNWYLFVLAVGSGVLLFMPTLNKGGMAGVTPAQAVQKMNREKAVVFDVRTADEFAGGHVKGSKNLAAEDVEKQLAAAVKNKATPVLFLCAGGPRASRAMVTAKKLGYENSFVISGGIKAWREAGLPVVSDSKAAA